MGTVMCSKSLVSFRLWILTLAALPAPNTYAKKQQKAAIKPVLPTAMVFPNLTPLSGLYPAARTQEDELHPINQQDKQSGSAPVLSLSRTGARKLF